LFHFASIISLFCISAFSFALHFSSFWIFLLQISQIYLRYILFFTTFFANMKILAQFLLDMILNFLLH